jgi:acetylornithine deacetylase/succinyl-diaminopimelate desuccinylase-like protein
MPSVQPAVEFARARRENSLADLKELLAIPSISTLPEHQPDMRRAAEWLRAELERIGLSRCEILPSPGGGHPVVYGEWMRAPGQPTVLVYAHYDVQPVDPLDEWRSPPFAATLRGDNLFARGASDMKGQTVAVIKAVEALMQAQGGLPVNVKFLIEGEEEIGSPHLDAFIQAQAERLQSDFSLNADSSILGPQTPSLVYSIRGLAYFEVWVRGPEHDLHSGMFGGAVHNPAQVLCELVAGMHDADGHITLPGYYASVRPLAAEERAVLARRPHDDEQWRANAGSPPALRREAGYTTIECIGARPTLEVNGLYSGFIGEGSKTVLPAKAMAKISMRLVPDQTPAGVGRQLREYLRRNAPSTVTWEVKDLAQGPGLVMDRDTPHFRAAARALETVFGAQPVYLREGGSVPVVGLLKERLNVDSVMMGFGLPDDNLHAPNEKQNLPNFYRGIETYIHFFANLAR